MNKISRICVKRILIFLMLIPFSALADTVSQIEVVAKDYCSSAKAILSESEVTENQLKLLAIETAVYSSLCTTTGDFITLKNVDLSTASLIKLAATEDAWKGLVRAFNGNDPMMYRQVIGNKLLSVTTAQHSLELEIRNRSGKIVDKYKSLSREELDVTISEIMRNAKMENTKVRKSFIK